MLNSVENSIINPHTYHYKITDKKLIMSSSVSRRSHTPTCESIVSQHDSLVTTPTRTSSLADTHVTPSKDTTEQLYTRVPQLHHHESPQLTSLKVRLDGEDDDEHDENSDSAYYHAHHHLPLTPPIVLLPSPCTPLTESSSSPAPSSPPASPLASPDITLTSVAVTPITHLSPPSSHSPVAASSPVSNCVSSPKVSSPLSPTTTTTTTTSLTIESTVTATIIPQSEPLGEFKRAGSTRRSQRFRPYGSDSSRSRPKAEPVKSNAHLCDITPLTVDTDLANGQSALAQRSRVVARQSAAQVGEQILSVMRENRFDSLTQILSASKPVDLNVFVDGQTLLHHCLLLGRDVSWCKELVMAGANPNLSNRDGWHPLHLAACRGATETLNYLVLSNDVGFSGNFYF